MKLTNIFYSAHKRSRPFYVTTPIFYVNSVPHIGHLYSAVIADTIQRFERLVDPKCRVKLSTGTDEHGTKVQQAASKHGKSPMEYCTVISQQYKTLFQDANVQFTDYIRTTEERHKNAVQHFWSELNKNDYIYTSHYSGWYCVSDETFLTDSHLKNEVRDGKEIKVSIESGHPVEWTEEQNYMFRLSSFKSDLKYWLKEDGVVQPAKYQHILKNMISNNEFLPDISISRPIDRVHWSIQVPDDPSQGVYVWLDALINYLTVLGYPDNTALSSEGNSWPADVHVIGKDILKFHGLYWPAFLFACGLNPPRKILCHSHWTVDGQKMSKSLGNVVDPYQTIGGLEALRYFLLREGTMHSDANYSETKMVRILNSQLADTLGNLLNRCTGVGLNSRQEFPQLHVDQFRKMRQSEVGEKLTTLVDNLPGTCYEHYSDFSFYKVADSVMAALHAANQFFEYHRPWDMKKSAELQKDLDVVLHVTMETLRVCGIILQPIIPEMSKKLLDKLAIPASNRHWDNIYTISWQSDMILETRNISTDKLVLFQKIQMEKERKVILQQSI